MRRKNYKGKRNKRNLQKCTTVFRAYDTIQNVMGDVLANDTDIVEIKCNVAAVKKLLYYKVPDNCHRVNQDNGRLHKEYENPVDSNERLREENTALREQNRNYSLLRKVFGRNQIDDLVRQARETQKAQRQRQRSYER